MKKFFLNYDHRIIILLFFTLILFLFSIPPRKPWMGVLSENGHQWVTGHSLLISRQWFFEGPNKFDFGLPWNPKSIEFPDIKSRGIYSSFPSGMIWPIYLISKVLNHQPNITMVMRYNLINHFLVAYILSCISYIILNKNGISKCKSLFFSTLVSVITLFSPGPFYWFQNTYFSQEAIILPFCLIILFETLKTYQSKYVKTINIFQSLTLFYALYTDWLAVFIVVVLIANQFFHRNHKIKTFLINTLHITIPSIIFLLLFIYQTISLSSLSSLMDKFLFRTAVSNSGKDYITNFFNQFWKGHALEAFGYSNLLPLLILMVFFILSIIKKFINKKNTQNKIKFLSLVNLLLIPNLLEIYILKNHSAIHNFTALKLVIPISLSIPLILIFIKNWFDYDITNISINGLFLSISDKKYPIKVPILFILLLSFGIFLIKNPQKFNHFQKPNYLFNDISEFIRNNTNENEIVFSPNFQIPVIPPQRLSLSLKRVYLIENIDQIQEKIKNINSKDRIIDIFVLGKNYPDKNIEKLISSAYEVKTMIVNADQKDTVVNDINYNTEVNQDTKEKTINTINSWNDNHIFLYKIKL